MRPVGRPRVPLFERLEARLRLADSGCWEWTGRLTNGYGRVALGGANSPTRLVHRAMWELVVGPIPPSLTLDHLCRNRACANPDHLEPVTQRENILRGEGQAAGNAAKTHCPQGHPYDAENTYVSASGRRHCRPCNRAAVRRAYSRRRARLVMST